MQHTNWIPLLLTFPEPDVVATMKVEEKRITQCLLEHSGLKQNNNLGTFLITS